MSWKHLIKGIIICAKCGKPDDRRAVKQKFCRDCSVAETRRRRREWQKTHPREPESERQERVWKRNEFIQAHGESVSVEKSKGPLLLPDRSAWAKSVRIEFPFTGHLSKNCIGNIGMMTGKPFIFVRQDVYKLRDAIAILLRSKLGTSSWPKSKTWIDVVVQKPDHRSDAINVVDTLCDGLKVGLNLDDRWFAIGTLDWELVLRNPMVFVQVSTEAERDQKNCSTCGQIKYLEEGFRPHETTTDRRAGICNDCTTALSRSKGKNMNGSIPNPIS